MYLLMPDEVAVGAGWYADATVDGRFAAQSIERHLVHGPVELCGFTEERPAALIPSVLALYNQRVNESPLARTLLIGAPQNLPPRGQVGC
ncbi:MAG TPA: hypothetical protein VGS41_05610 [Chthonomonadales bacterium]|nr:hypothetical protein [Chthonomonadales bacterium]